MKYHQRLLVLGAVDALVSVLVVVAAYFLRFDFQIPPEFLNWLPEVIVGQVLINLLVFMRSKLYLRVWRYASIVELVAILTATTISQVLFFAVFEALEMYTGELVVPMSVYLMIWFMLVVGVGGSRLLWRIIRDSFLKQQPHHLRTLVVGAGSAGAMVARELRQKGHSSEFYPVAFIDDDPMKQGLAIMGLPVVGNRYRIPEIVEAQDIQKIILALPSISKEEVAKVIEICKSTKASIHILPSVAELIRGNMSMRLIREVRVEDLLGRDVIQTDLHGIAEYVSDQVVLITGAGGSIGSELCRQILPFSPKQLLLLGHGENSIYEIEQELRSTYPGTPLVTVIADIQDRERMEEVFADYRPAVVFHAAAHKHVPLMERNPAEAVKNNIIGTRNVAECAHQFGAERFVMISSDKAVNPTNVMGASKRVAELIIQSLDRVSQTKFVAVRFGNVLGSRGSVVPIFKKQIEKGGPITVTHPEMLRYFMTIPEAVQLVIQAGALANGGEIFILDMGRPVKIADLARDLIRLSGLEPDRDIQITYSGIRPGEKLYEELLMSEEGMTSTQHNRIFIGKPTQFDAAEVLNHVEHLREIAHDKQAVERAAQIKQAMQRIVPTYQFMAETPATLELQMEAMKRLQQAQKEIAAASLTDK